MPKLDAVWLHRSTGICNYLYRAHSLDRIDLALATFAVMWAPYGGASEEDLLVTFGIRRREFVSRVAAALTPIATDEELIPDLKTKLREEITQAWSTTEPPNSSRPPNG